MAGQKAPKPPVQFLGPVDLWAVLKISGIEVWRSALEHLQAKSFVQRRLLFLRKNVAPMPVHNHDEINETMEHPDLGDVRALGLVRPPNFKPFQQIRINLMVRPRNGQPRLGLDRRQPQQPLDSLAVGQMSPALKPGRHLADPKIRRIGELLRFNLEMADLPIELGLQLVASFFLLRPAMVSTVIQFLPLSVIEKLPPFGFMFAPFRARGTNRL